MGAIKWTRLSCRTFAANAVRLQLHALAWIGHRIEPMLQLSIQIVEIAEAAGEEEVLADRAIGSLDLALGLGSVGLQAFGWKP